jgi:multidrug resistance efflux pump
MPLRPKTAAPVNAQPNQAPQQMMQGGGGGGRGNNPNQMMERPGSTRIISILPEGTLVQEGDEVCVLDSAAFRDEFAAQKIRHLEAESFVRQAQSLLKVNELAYEEYKNGILPQDRELLKNYIDSCRSEVERADITLKWSIGALKKGLISPAMHNSDKYSLQRAQIALAEALKMQERLELYAVPRLLKNLEAKVAAIQTDLLAQEAALSLETARLKRLERAIDKCSMKAPRDGIVVYANPANNWGRVDNQIREGSTVREGQAVFNLPDPTRMRVRARVNESKVSYIHRGQRVEINVDAFPDHPLRGTVAEVTAIPAPASGPISDVKVYYAMIDIEGGGFAELRPGLTAQLGFALDVRHDVIRIPIEAIRRVSNRTYAAVATAQGFAWRKLELGAVSPSFAEVVSGVSQGEPVVLNPDVLPPPSESGLPATAGLSAGPRG